MFCYGTEVFTIYLFLKALLIVNKTLKVFLKKCLKQYKMMNMENMSFMLKQIKKG